MTLAERLDLLAELGRYLLQPTEEPALTAVIQRAYVENKWFTPDNTRRALRNVATQLLQPEALKAWAAQYPISTDIHPAQTVALIPAGNIPLVGFHDWLCVFVAGHRAQVKLSEKDKLLLPFLVGQLGQWAFESWEYTLFLTENERLADFDAVIATGSNNTARYFEQYFGKYPHIIRKNRNSLAVLDGQERMADLYALGDDVVAYFGLGCRNVSKLYVPAGYDFNPLLEAFHAYNELANHDKYKNNFDYNMTLLLLNQIPFLNNGCVLLTENVALASRIAAVHYEQYGSDTQLAANIAAQQAAIQCVAVRPGHAWLSRPPAGVAVVPFGQTQLPTLHDYPDGVDVMAFLTQDKWQANPNGR